MTHTPVPAVSLDLDPGLLARLAAGAGAADRRPAWPTDSWAALRDAGVPGWAVPREYGGASLGPVELLAAGEALAAACLTTAFIPLRTHRGGGAPPSPW